MTQLCDFCTERVKAREKNWPTMKNNSQLTNTTPNNDSNNNSGSSSSNKNKEQTKTAAPAFLHISTNKHCSPLCCFSPPTPTTTPRLQTKTVAPCVVLTPPKKHRYIHLYIHIHVIYIYTHVYVYVYHIYINIYIYETLRTLLFAAHITNTHVMYIYVMSPTHRVSLRLFSQRHQLPPLRSWCLPRRKIRPDVKASLSHLSTPYVLPEVFLFRDLCSAVVRGMKLLLAKVSKRRCTSSGTSADFEPKTLIWFGRSGEQSSSLSSEALVWWASSTSTTWCSSTAGLSAFSSSKSPSKLAALSCRCSRKRDAAWHQASQAPSCDVTLLHWAARMCVAKRSRPWSLRAVKLSWSWSFNALHSLSSMFVLASPGRISWVCVFASASTLLENSCSAWLTWCLSTMLLCPVLTNVGALSVTLLVSLAWPKASFFQTSQILVYGELWDHWLVSRDTKSHTL